MTRRFPTPEYNTTCMWSLQINWQELYLVCKVTEAENKSWPLTPKSIVFLLSLEPTSIIHVKLWSDWTRIGLYRARKAKRGRGHWVLASCQVSLNSIHMRSGKFLSQSETGATILVFRSARKTTREPGALYRAQEYHCNLALFFCTWKVHKLMQIKHLAPLKYLKEN